MTTAALASSQRAWRKPSGRASNAALRAWMPPIPMLRPIVLARGKVLRVRNGAGTVVHVRFGVVWITEEASRRDAILRNGESHVVTLDGLTVVHADRDARLVLEFRGDSASEACVEVAAGYGAPGRVVPNQACGRSLAERVAAAGERARNAVKAALAAMPLRWHRDAFVLEREAHTPEAVRHRLMHASRDPFPFY